MILIRTRLYLWCRSDVLRTCITIVATAMDWIRYQYVLTPCPSGRTRCEATWPPISTRSASTTWKGRTPRRWSSALSPSTTRLAFPYHSHFYKIIYFLGEFVVDTLDHSIGHQFVDKSSDQCCGAGADHFWPEPVPYLYFFKVYKIAFEFND